jgi:imidazolonepropionase-like amidohydrolase
MDAIRVLALIGATLVDGTERAPVRDAVVVVQGERIVAAGPRGSVEVPPGAETLDLRGRFLIPGLVDMHAHVLVPRCDPGAAATRFDRPLSERMLGVLLRSGITTVRSPATPTELGVALRDDVAAGRVVGPRIFASAEFIDGDLTPEQVRREVRDRLRHRVDFIKLYARLSPEAVRAGIQEAHAAQVPVIGHLSRTSWTDAARLGIDFLTHAASWSAGELPDAKRAAYERARRERGPMKARIDWLELVEPDGPEIATMVRELAERKISVDPTLVAYDSKFLAPVAARYRQNPHRAVVPELLDDWQRCGTPTDDWTASDYKRMAAAWPKLLSLVKRYHDGGVLLTAGSDVTNPWVIPGESLHQELELLVSAGLTPAEVLRIATLNGARSLGRETDFGTIEPGRRADLIVLTRDPIARIGDTRAIDRVMHDGRWVER